MPTVDFSKASGFEVAEAAVKRIASLYAVEKVVRGKSPEERASMRQERAKPVFDDLETWLQAQLPRHSGKSELATAIRYALTRMSKMHDYLDHSVLELNNNTAERSMRCLALGRKNYLLVRSRGSGKAAAIAFTRSKPPS